MIANDKTGRKEVADNMFGFCSDDDDDDDDEFVNDDAILDAMEEGAGETITPVKLESVGHDAHMKQEDECDDPYAEALKRAEAR